MRHSQYQDYQSVIVDLIHYAVISDPNSPQILRAGHFGHAWRAGIIRQRVDFSNDPSLYGNRQSLQGSICR